MDKKNIASVGRMDQPENGRATIFDVAEKAGVSFVSVSRVFNEHPNVSLKMRERVLHAAREMGYQPRLVCRNNLIAVLVDPGEAMTGRCDKSHLCGKIFEAAARHNYLMELVTLEHLDRLTQRLVDGVIELNANCDDLHEHPELVHLPMVMTHCRAEIPEWSSVLIDYQHEGELGLSSLMRKGHRKIAVLVGDLKRFSNSERLLGIRKYMKKKSVPLQNVTLIELKDGEIPNVCDRLRKEGPTGILNFSNNHMPKLADQLFNVLKLDLPRDFSLITVDNTGFSEHYHPRISYIVEPLDQLAAASVKLLEKLIHDRSSPEHILLKSCYHERNTCRSPNDHSGRDHSG